MSKKFVLMNNFNENSIQKLLEKLEIQSNLEKTRQINVPQDERMLAISKDTGQLIDLILRLLNAKFVLEIGMSVGYSTLWSANVIQKNLGMITTIENNQKKIVMAKNNFSIAGIEKSVEIIENNALDAILSMKNNESFLSHFDFILIDADKENIIEYVENVLPLLRIGGIIMVDNMLYPEKYSSDMNKLISYLDTQKNLHFFTLGVGNGEEIILKIS